LCRLRGSVVRAARFVNRGLGKHGLRTPTHLTKELRQEVS
jgi:hypothetical protein